MKIVFRDKDNKVYWDERWESAGVDEDAFVNEDIYPIKYSNMVVVDKKQRILEAGCGAGRVFFHYHNLGYDIRGLEYSRIAVDNILKKDSRADVACGSITKLPYGDNVFDVVLAFGLYHNIEDIKELEKSFNETARVLKTGGKLVASVRLDSLENKIIEHVVRKRKGDAIGEYNKFHRWHFDEKDIKNYLNMNGFRIERVFYSRNVSFLFKFNTFRTQDMMVENFCESDARSRGFQLNLIGRWLDSFLHRAFPRQFSNIIVIIASKKDNKKKI